jgi:hypothetical protein
MLVYLIIAAVVLGLLLAAAWGFSFRRAIETAKPLVKTDTETKIEAEGQDLLDRIEEQKRIDDKEVANAQGTGLRRLFVRRMFDRD